MARSKKGMIRLLIFISFSLSLSAQRDTVYLNSGYESYQSDSLLYLRFNQSEESQPYSALSKLSSGETLDLTIINRDTESHTIGFQDAEYSLTDTLTISTPLADGVHILEVLGDEGLYLGAKMLVYAGDLSYATYSWQLSDLQKVINDDLKDRVLDSTWTYQPDVFSINGRMYPNTLNDSLAYVEEQVGDTIRIVVGNTGLMEHALHFHGYHVDILWDSEDQMTNWIKDTFPLKKGQTKLLQLVPHQAGVFPVHDHNLIVVTNNGLYPGGMLTRLNISE